MPGSGNEGYDNAILPGCPVCVFRKKKDDEDIPQEIR